MWSRYWPYSEKNCLINFWQKCFLWKPIPGLGRFTWTSTEESSSTGPPTSWNCWQFCSHRWKLQDDWPHSTLSKDFCNAAIAQQVWWLCLLPPKKQDFSPRTSNSSGKWNVPLSGSKSILSFQKPGQKFSLGHQFLVISYLWSWFKKPIPRIHAQSFLIAYRCGCMVMGQKPNATWENQWEISWVELSNICSATFMQTFPMLRQTKVRNTHSAISCISQFSHVAK